MVITAMTPNLDGHLYVKQVDEHRKEKLLPVVLFVATSDMHGNSAISVMVISNGKLAMGNGDIIRDET